ncbi:MAG TPA: hypothetical protein DHN29_11865 [Cytophagales bacterium]|nr:hypothetical protein [Cytophagales bacterium]|tara:strand:+ start:266 stop:1051 length:786 start_codon:yes stop_codon:yes gene_type:complete
MDQELFYEKNGEGEKTLIFFHGFGQNHKILSPWVELTNKQYTIYNFDLYYHGNSSRPDIILSPEEWKSLFANFLKENNIDHFHLAAFSLGGRFALTTYQLFPEHTRSITLVAPDGIYENFWYLLAVSKGGNKLFKYFMLHPTVFNRFLKLVEKLKLTSSQMIRFAQKELFTKENRKRVYRSWTYFRPLQPKLNLINDLIKSKKTPIHLILGSKDLLVPIDKIKSKMDKSESVYYHILPLKHHQLIDGAKTLIPSLLEEVNL